MRRVWAGATKWGSVLKNAGNRCPVTTASGCAGLSWCVLGFCQFLTLSAQWAEPTPLQTVTGPSPPPMYWQACHPVSLPFVNSSLFQPTLFHSIAAHLLHRCINRKLWESFVTLYLTSINIFPVNIKTYEPEEAHNCCDLFSRVSVFCSFFSQSLATFSEL